MYFHTLSYIQCDKIFTQFVYDMFMYIYLNLLQNTALHNFVIN